MMENGGEVKTMILAGDIGGTKTLLGLFDTVPARPRPVVVRSFGTLDYPDEFLATLDLVVASLHTSLRQPREKVTQRVINAIRNPHVDIIGHPTGRLIQEREGADLDMEAVLQAAAESGG